MTANMPNADLLDDLCTRFILNVPAEELQCVSFLYHLLALTPALEHTPELAMLRRSVEKLMFLVEQAHWFYEVSGPAALPLRLPA